MVRKSWLLIAAVGIAAALTVTGAPVAVGQNKTVEPFNGRNLDGWIKREGRNTSQWVVGKARMNPQERTALLVEPVASGGELINAKAESVDIYTAQKWGDVHIEVELMYPAGSNSGIYVCGEYEVQVLDSARREVQRASDLGGLYRVAAPKVNAAKGPGEWQKFVIDFRAPRFEGERKVRNARFDRVLLNGQVIHENVEMPMHTPTGVTQQEHPTGPILLQGDHGPVAYRNIKVTPR